MKRSPILLLVGVVLFLGLGNTPAALAIFHSPAVTVTVIETPTVTPTPTMGPPQLFPSALCGYPGQVLAVDGLNFNPDRLINVSWSGMVLGTDPARIQADPAGRISFRFVVPNDESGSYRLQVSDDEGVAEFTFILGQDCSPPPATATPAIPTSTATPTPTATPPTPAPDTPSIRCEPETAVPEQRVTVHGQNFHPGGHFDQLRWDGVVIPWAPAGLTVGDDGAFTLWFNAPADTYQLHTLVADDGLGRTAACYLNLTPRDPTPTWTPTATLTPTPTASPTPGPPPGLTLTPTATPGPDDYCAAIDAVFTRNPLANSLIEAGLVITNTHQAWPADRLQVEIWQYANLSQTDTGARAGLPALDAGDSTTAPLSFPVVQTGPMWFQARLIDAQTGQPSACASPWFPLTVRAAEPYPPPLLRPGDHEWLNTHQLTLDWLPAEGPDGAGPVEGYELQLTDLATGDLLSQSLWPDVTAWDQTLTNEYGPGQLAWRVRARNAAGWGLWTTPFYFGLDTVPPQVNLSLTGQPGDDGWWRSPLTVRVGGDDAPPGSGLQATYLQRGEGRWQQVIPGGDKAVETEGVYVLRAYGRDRALNRSPVLERPVKIDWRPPQVDAAFSHEPTSSGWYTAPLTITIEAEDLLSGVATRAVRIDPGPWRTEAITLTDEGTYSLDFFAWDGAGNETEVRQTTAKLDLTPPAGDLALNGTLCQVCQPAMVQVAAGDTASGLAHWTLTLALPPATATPELAVMAAAPATPTPTPIVQGDTILASGNNPTAQVALDGRALPVGVLTLRLAVQDGAGWVTNQELVVENAPYTPGPTPTPWVMATSTPWPTATPGVSPYATITPTPGSPGGGGGGGDGGGGAGDGGGDTPLGQPRSPVAYPVGGTAVPAILPVTGTSEPGGGQLVPLLALVLLVALGLAAVNRRRGMKRAGETPPSTPEQGRE